METLKIPDVQLESIAKKISHSTYEFMRKSIEREIKLLSRKGNINLLDIASIIMMALSSTTANILLTSSHFLSKNAEKKISLEILLLNHISSLKIMVNAEEWRSLKEKMN
jgi:hypothetical protein